jgi:Holliday junction resolvasome RuvABC endonuclease subunit
MKIMSIDGATRKSGWSTFEKDNGIWLIECGIYRSKDSLNATDRIEDMFMQMKTEVELFKPDYVVFEDSPGVSITTTKMLSRLHGCIMGLAYIYDLGLYEYLPSQWRSIMEFKGSTKREFQKQRAIAHVNEKYGMKLIYDKSDKNGHDDIAEAICIGEAFIKDRMKEVVECIKLK